MDTQKQNEIDELQALKIENEKLTKEVWNSINALSDKIADTNKSVAETQKSIQALREELGGVGLSNGMVAEEFVYNSLKKDMTFAGVKFDYIEPNKKREIRSSGIDGEYDIVLTNGDTLAII